MNYDEKWSPDSLDFYPPRQIMNWYIYIIYCSDGSLYTGISNDVYKRYEQHTNKRGAKYFRGRQPKQLVYLESGHTRSTASKREAVIKKLSRKDKVRLLESEKNELITASL
jgi:putative endonuclease